MRGSEVLREVPPTQQANRTDEPERFVDSVVAAKFLSIQRRQLLQLAREGKIPAYPIGDGQRRLWRFRLSDLARAMEQRMVHRKGTDSMGVKKPRSIRQSKRTRA
jgi:excisionase family DNA binding protein